MKKRITSLIIYLIVLVGSVWLVYNLIKALDAEITRLPETTEDNYAFTRPDPVTRAPPVTEAAVTQPATDPPADNSKISNAVKYSGDLELPVNGATGYASVGMDILSTDNYTAIYTLKPGEAFQILREDGEWWLILCPDGVTLGWVQHIFCMINLPDVIPSVIYKNTNAYSSLYRCYYGSAIKIPGITGQQLYKYSDKPDGRAYNKRLKKDEYIVPVLYSMAKRIYIAQKNAMKNNDSLVIYEGYRPLETQTKVYKAVQDLAEKDPNVQRGFGAWNMSWFIAGSISSHQFGYAIDVSLAQIVETQEAIAGKYKYTQVTMSIEYIMPTQIHELSATAITFTKGITPESPDAWKDAKFSEGMLNTPKAQDLQKYCTGAGLTPLASEWWHFNDLNTLSELKIKCQAKFEIKDCLSVAP